MVKCIFTTKATAQQYRIEPNGSVFNSLAPANGYAQKNCAERFSALNMHNWVEVNWGEHQNEVERAAICIFVAFVYFFLQQIVVV